MADPTNINELMLSVNELTATLDWGLTSIQKNVDCMFNCKDDAREAIISLFANLWPYRNQLCQPQCIDE